MNARGPFGWGCATPAVLGLKGMVVDEEMVVAMRAAFDEGRDVLLRAEEE